MYVMSPCPLYMQPIDQGPYRFIAVCVFLFRASRAMKIFVKIFPKPQISLALARTRGRSRMIFTKLRWFVRVSRNDHVSRVNANTANQKSRAVGLWRSLSNMTQVTSRGSRKRDTNELQPSRRLPPLRPRNH